MPTTTSINDAELYTGDDWAQGMSRVLAVPMLVMGLMIVAGAFVVGVLAGVNLGDFFDGSTVSALGRGEVLVQVSGAVAFLGMGLILAGVVMSLVNIVRTLRDSGRDVQQAVGADAYKLRKPSSGVLTPWVMMTGLMIEMVAFGLGIFAAATIGGVNPTAIASGANAGSGDLADIGVTRALSAWLPGLRLVGIAVLLVAVVLVLTTIRSVLRFQARRVDELVTTGRPTEPALTGIAVAN
jgi:hypothetical protein